MSVLIELVMSSIELLKIQVEKARISAAELIVTLVLLQSAALLVLAAAGFLLVGLFMTLLNSMHVMLAALVTAGVCGLLAAITFISARQRGSE